ncbi:methionine gamma-lyase family protein [Bacillus paranthracis]
MYAEKGVGSFKEYNIGYNAVPLTEEGLVDFGAVAAAIHSNTKMIGIQRSKRLCYSSVVYYFSN